MQLYLIAVDLHWLSKWQDRCYLASHELFSNYLYLISPTEKNTIRTNYSFFLVIFRSDMPISHFTACCRLKSTQSLTALELDSTAVSQLRDGSASDLWERV